MLPVVKRAAEQNHRCELADIFRHYGEEYRQKHSLPLLHLRVMQAVERCRTAALGGHLQQCDSCGFERPGPITPVEIGTAPSANRWPR